MSAVCIQLYLVSMLNASYLFQIKLAGLSPCPPLPTDSFQSAVLSCELLCRLVLKATETHTSHDILVESSLEVLILLSQNGMCMLVT